MKNTTSLELNPDQPLVSVKQDKLGRGQFAKNLAETIIQYPPGRPIVIGLYGSWGSGKTSVINFVKEHIENVKKAADQEQAKALADLVYFDSWMLANQENLVERFLETVLNQIKGKDKKAKYKQIADILEKWLLASRLVSVALSKKTILNIAKILFAIGLIPGAIGFLAKIPFLYIVGAGLLILSSLISLFQDSATELVAYFRTISREQKSLIELRRELAEGVGVLENNLVIIIDEIDRLTTDEVRHVFQLVKSTFNLPHIIYLLAFDRDKIGGVLTTDHFDGSAYIEKIVQLPIHVPIPDRQLIRSFLDEEISGLIKPLPDRGWDNEWWHKVYGGGLRKIILKERNPRTILRLFNKIRGELYSVLPEVNPVDCIAISVIQALYPNEYNYIAARKSIFTRDLLSGLENALRGENAIKADISAFWGNLDHDLASLLGLLFPTAEEYLSNTKYGQEWEQIWLAEKRICSHLCFDRYFNRAVPIGETTYSALEEFIDCSDVPELEKRLHTELKNGTLMDFLERLESLSADVPEKNVHSVIISLFILADKLPAEYAGYLISPHLRIADITTRLLKTLNKAIAGQVLEPAIRESKGLISPISLVDQYARKVDEGRVNDVPIDVNLIGPMKMACVANIQELYQSKKLIEARHLGFVLNRWRSWSDKKFIDIFLEEVLNNQDHLLQLLPNFVLQGTQSDSQGTRVVYSFDFEGLANLIDLQRVKNNVIGLSSSGTARYPEDQARALDLFARNYQAFRNSGHNIRT